MISVVPQGSGQGPLLFIIYSEILLKCIKNHNEVSLYAFADDLKLLSPDMGCLQNALYIVQQWSKEWQMNIQPSKSEQISFLQPRKHTSTSQLLIDNATIPSVSEVRDLGVIISNDFKWSTYIGNIYSKSKNTIYLILRAFKSNDPFFFINLYKMYARPILEYNVSAWMPTLTTDINKLESLQRLFTRRLCQNFNIKYRNYNHRLKMFNLDSLEMRRIKTDLILFYKIFNHLIDLDKSNFCMRSKVLKYYQLRRNQYHLQWPDNPKTTIRRNFFTYRITNLWNNLPNTVVASKSLTQFKTQLNNLDLYKLYNTKFTK